MEVLEGATAMFPMERLNIVANPYGVSWQRYAGTRFRVLVAVTGLKTGWQTGTKAARIRTYREGLAPTALTKIQRCLQIDVTIC
jgi:hypothetical protein